MDHNPTIIKLGSTMPSLATRHGDFEDWVISGMGLTRDDVRVIDPTQGEALPPPDALPGIVLTGSHAMVTDREPWSEEMAVWLREAVLVNVPILGICYGHQLLAHALGGEVDDNPQGREFGTVEAHLTAQAADDPLLGGLGNVIRVHTGHTQTVLRLPSDARLLATSALDHHFAFAIGEVVWGVQFHPEFDAEVARTYIHAFRTTLAAEGQDPDRLAATCSDTPTGSTILRRFAEIVRTRVSRKAQVAGGATPW